MKLLDDDDKKREENNDETIEKNKLQHNNTSGDIGCIMKTMTEAKEDKNIVKNGITLNKKGSPDDLKSGKSIVMERRKDDREINVNMNVAKNEKLMRTLTEKFNMLRFGCKDVVNVGRREADIENDDPEFSDKTSDGDRKSNTDSVDDITASVKAIVLDSELKDTAKQTNGHVVLIAEKCEVLRVEANCVKNEAECIPRGLDKDGEENEDLEDTRLISDANYMSLLSRGPYNGIPKCSGIQDSDNYIQPLKYSRPFREQGSCNPHMSGGSVQVVPLNTQTPVFDLNNFARLNTHSTNLSYEKTIHPSLLPPMDDVNLAHGYPFGFCPELDWPPNPQLAALWDSGNGYPFLRDMIDNCDDLSLSQHAFDLGLELDGYNPLSPNSPNSLLVDSQLSTRSPHDQVLSSPGSSPPSHAYSPYSVSSVVAKDCDTTVMSPGSYSMPSPDDGIGADLTEDDYLTVAIDYINEQKAKEFMAGKRKTPPIPELVEAVNTGLDPIGSSLLPISGRACPTTVASTGRSGTRGVKKSAHKTRTSKQVARVLPPVTDGGRMPSGGVVLSPGINFNPSTDFHTPCIFDQGNKKPMPIKPRTIQPKPTPDSFASSAVQTSQPSRPQNLQ